MYLNYQQVLEKTKLTKKELDAALDYATTLNDFMWFIPDALEKAGFDSWNGDYEDIIEFIEYDIIEDMIREADYQGIIYW